MSRCRTGHGPDDWTVNEPSPVVTRHRTYASVPCATGKDMRPVMTPGAVFERGHQTGPHARRAFSIIPANRFPE